MIFQEKIKNAGCVGCGGAGFPTHVKLSGKFSHLIINAAECEPLLYTDRTIMKMHADRIIFAATALLSKSGAEDCKIALKSTYIEEIASLKKAISEQNSPVSLHLLDSFYPAGDEQVVVFEVTGHIVPPAGIPLDVGCVVLNLATVLCISDALLDVPFTDKYLTVTGEVDTPSVMRVPLGTSFPECISYAGGAKLDDYFVISGGPMMGKPLSKQEAKNAVVTKTTSGIILLPKTSFLSAHHETPLLHIYNRAKSACIQCSYCTSLCPRNLLGHPLEPHRIMRKMALSGDVSDLLSDPVIRNAALCSECGICELYACPMGLSPRRVNKVVKEALIKANIRYEKTLEEFSSSPERALRKIPTKRASTRVGILKYYDLKPAFIETSAPAMIRLLLKQHIGAPSEAIVTTGEVVKKGQLIAKIKPDALGANLHASISGTVTLLEDSIVIKQ